MKSEKEGKDNSLPSCVAEYIESVIRKVRYRRGVRREVRRELTGHFVDALGDCESEKERNELGEKLIAEFGEAKVLAKLIRRGKKRCRPLWKKAMIRTCQVMGIFLVVFVLRWTHLSVGKSTINTDYVQWINERAQDGRDESLNAKPVLDKAAEFVLETDMEELRETFPDLPEVLTEEQEAAIEKYLAESEESLRYVLQAMKKPYYWTVCKRDPNLESIYPVHNRMLVGEITSTLSQDMGAYRKISYHLALRISWDLHQKNIREAWKNCLVLQKLGIFIQSGSLDIEKLNGIATERSGNNRMFQILDQGKLSAGDVSRLQIQLERLYEGTAKHWDYSMEKAFWYDLVQRMFTDDGEGGGRILMDSLSLVASDYRDMIQGFLLGYPDRKEFIDRIDVYYDRVQKLNEKTPWQLRLESIDIIGFPEIMENIMDTSVESQFSLHIRLSEIFWRMKTERVALSTILALKRWRMEQGVYPVQLAELIESGYLKQLPKDPYSDGILRYERRGEDFILYSVGADFADDGGTRNPEEKWGWGEEGGDRVFWPLEFSHE